MGSLVLLLPKIDHLLMAYISLIAETKRLKLREKTKFDR